MITANLVQTWELYHLVQVRSLVLMKNVQIVITNPAVNPVMTGTPRHKPARHNVQVLINMLVPVQTKLEEVVQLVAENIRRALALAVMTGAAALAKNVQAAINIPAPALAMLAVTALPVMGNMHLVNVQADIIGEMGFVEKIFVQKALS